MLFWAEGDTLLAAADVGCSVMLAVELVADFCLIVIWDGSVTDELVSVGDFLVGG